MIDTFTAADLKDVPRMARHDAARALIRAASAYRMIAKMAPAYRIEAMRVCVTRPYLFERNEQRWPDGLHHLLNRSYQPWLGHRIACHEETLHALGVSAWGRSAAVQVGFSKGCAPLVDDVLQGRPRPRYLLRLADILDALAERT